MCIDLATRLLAAVIRLDTGVMPEYAWGCVLPTPKVMHSRKSYKLAEDVRFVYTMGTCGLAVNCSGSMRFPAMRC
jgi:hypothetical protein